MKPNPEIRKACEIAWRAKHPTIHVARPGKVVIVKSRKEKIRGIQLRWFNDNLSQDV